MSTLGSHLADYLALRRTMGYDLADAARLLPRLVAYCDQAGLESLTVETMLTWAQAPRTDAGSTVHGRRMTAARGFARYLSGIDPRTEVPAPGLISTRRSRPSPYIYTDDEVDAIIEAVPRVVTSPFKAHTYVMVIGLLAATGMRIREVIGLHDTDIDTAAATLLVRESKFGKSRLVPVHATTMTALVDYHAHRERELPARKAPNVLVSTAGTALIYSEVCRGFREAADRTLTGNGTWRRPRLHDFRHTFAVRTLTSWYASGDDVAARLPLLSTYLGHREPRHTYWYLSATPELLARAAGMLQVHEEPGS